MRRRHARGNLTKPSPGANPFPTHPRKHGPQQMADFSRLELVREVAAILDISERKAKPLVEAVIQAMITVLRTGDRLYIQGLGVFSHKKRAGRYIGRNIPGMLQGKGWIPPYSRVIFTPESSLYYDLNKDLYADTVRNQDCA